MKRHLNKNYIEDHFVNIVNSNESNQPNINLTIKAAAKFPEELNLSNEDSNTKKVDIQHTKSKLGQW